MPYSPGEVAEKTGFSIDTLRYYERIGLLAHIGRTANGRRAFTDDDVAWLGTLRCLRDTGMPIARMQRYARLTPGGTDGGRAPAPPGGARRAGRPPHRRVAGTRAHIRSKIA